MRIFFSPLTIPNHTTCNYTAAFPLPGVCVVFVPSHGDSPSNQGETCTSLCSVRTGYTSQFIFLSVHINRGHTGGGGCYVHSISPTRFHSNGGHWGLFLLFFHAALPSSCGACLYFFYLEKSSTAPSPVDNDVELVLRTHEAFQLFLSLSTLSTRERDGWTPLATKNEGKHRRRKVGH